MAIDGDHDVDRSLRGRVSPKVRYGYDTCRRRERRNFLGIIGTCAWFQGC